LPREYKPNEVTNTDERAKSPRLETRQPDSNAKIENCLQRLKQELEMVAVDEGIQIDGSGMQSSNGESPRFES
jgi:hypothetical protein